MINSFRLKLNNVTKCLMTFLVIHQLHISNYSPIFNTVFLNCSYSSLYISQPQQWLSLAQISLNLFFFFWRLGHDSASLLNHPIFIHSPSLIISLIDLLLFLDLAILSTCHTLVLLTFYNSTWHFRCFDCMINVFSAACYTSILGLLLKLLEIQWFLVRLVTTRYSDPELKKLNVPISNGIKSSNAQIFVYLGTFRWSGKNKTVLDVVKSGSYSFKIAWVEEKRLGGF